MPKREIIDKTTGEVLDGGESVRYSCFRHTQDISWVAILNFNQLRAMHFLAWKMSNNGTVHLVDKKKRDMIAFLGVKERQYYKIIGQLLHLDLIRKISNGQYIVSPFAVFRGSPSKFCFMVDKYNEYEYKE